MDSEFSQAAMPTAMFTATLTPESPQQTSQDPSVMPASAAPQVPCEATVVRVDVGGVPFSIDRDTMAKLKSDFLYRLIDPDSGFAHPQDGVHVVEAADAECFSCILHVARFGGLPAISDPDKLLQEADFWLVRPLVLSALQKQTDGIRSQVRDAIFRKKTAFEYALEEEMKALR